MAVDVLITFLPCEVIEYILENDILSSKDLMNFAMACKQFFRSVTSSNKVWKKKFFQRWPGLKEIYDKTERNGNKVSDWMEEFHLRVQSRKLLMEELSSMSAKHYKKQELSHSRFRNFDPLFRQEFGAHPLAYHFLVDELISLIDEPSSDSNLTYKYYAYKIIRYLRQSYLADEWRNFVNLPSDKQTLERGAVLVSQWSQPERRVSEVLVSAQLDNIANSTKQLLRERYPNHPIFSTPIEKLDEWRDTNIDDNQWTCVETRQIMSALCEIMFEKMAFSGNSEMYYSSVNSFIDRVLENRKGIPITLAIVFESAARRLGVRCEAVSFPSHFLLRWKEKYNTPESELVENFYIDVFNGGQFLTKNSCPKIGGVSKCPIERYNIHNGTTAIEVIQRMANNLEVAGRQRTHLNGRAARLRSALDLLHMVRPYDTGTILHLARFYILHQMDLAELVEVLNDMQKNLDPASRGQANHILRMLQDYEKHERKINEEDVRPKIHPPEVEYGIGMIMQLVNYGQLCVIVGWDAKCESSEWVNDIEFIDLSNGLSQPFYHLLVDEGAVRYVAQENLVLAPTPGFVRHDEIGRYFNKFCGTHYSPNEEKQKEYPNDVEVCNRLFGLGS